MSIIQRAEKNRSEIAGLYTIPEEESEDNSGAPVRTRFAPSPTGYTHVGGLRTALFAWLVARQAKGQFIIRIEDTDKKREVKGAVEHLYESLKWLGIDWDEGTDVGGNHGPYRQSERLDIYKKYAQKLYDEGKAYADPTTPEQLTQWREQAKEEKRPFRFNEHRPKNPPAWDGKLPLRLKIDANISPDWHDEIRGPQKGTSENIDDFILIKADGFPTYNFAHIVDDFEMKITHVIRGDEFVSSMPKFLFLYKALGIEPPKFAHVPPILSKEGGKKLSKREGAMSALDWRDHGILPQALMNFLATLGWNDGTEQEVFTKEELIAKFSLQRIQKAGARFDENRLFWLNGQHMRKLSTEQLSELAAGHWPESAKDADESYKNEILDIVKDKLKTLAELASYTQFFFTEPKPPKLDDAKKQWIKASIESLEDSDFSRDDIESRLRKMSEELDLPPGKLFTTLRKTVTGQKVAPGLFETFEVLGKDKVIKRLRSAL